MVIRRIGGLEIGIDLCTCQAAVIRRIGGLETGSRCPRFKS